jgi:prepilin-type processing-associated H-X9-DG protein
VIEGTLWYLGFYPSDPSSHLIWPQYAGRILDDGSPGQSNIDRYRHGVYPRILSSGRFDDKSGRVMYNILFTDGHVNSTNSIKAGFRAIQMREP